MEYEIEQMKTKEDFSKLLNKFHKELGLSVDKHFLSGNIREMSDAKIGYAYLSLWHCNRFLFRLFDKFMRKSEELEFIKK